MKDTMPSLPDDDSAVYEGRRLILNRVDEEVGCTVIVSSHCGGGFGEVPEYCEQPEHDPFTERCWYHGPGSPIGEV